MPTSAIGDLHHRSVARPTWPAVSWHTATRSRLWTCQRASATTAGRFLTWTSRSSAASASRGRSNRRASAAPTRPDPPLRAGRRWPPRAAGRAPRRRPRRSDCVACSRSRYRLLSSCRISAVDRRRIRRLRLQLRSSRRSWRGSVPAQRATDHRRQDQRRSEQELPRHAKCSIRRMSKDRSANRRVDYSHHLTSKPHGEHNRILTDDSPAFLHPRLPPPMKLAVLGTDPDILALVEAASAAGHSIVWLGDVRTEDAAGARSDCCRACACPTIGSRCSTTGWPTRCSSAAARRRMRCGPSSSSGWWPTSCRCSPCIRSAPRCSRTSNSTWRGTKCTACCGTIRRSPVRRRSTELAEWVQAGDGPIGIVHQIICQRSARRLRPRVGRFAIWHATSKCCARWRAACEP